jgi:hypothetical protein
MIQQCTVFANGVCLPLPKDNLVSAHCFRSAASKMSRYCGRIDDGGYIVMTDCGDSEWRWRLGHRWVHAFTDDRPWVRRHGLLRLVTSYYLSSTYPGRIPPLVIIIVLSLRSAECLLLHRSRYAILTQGSRLITPLDGATMARQQGSSTGRSRRRSWTVPANRYTG